VYPIGAAGELTQSDTAYLRMSLCGCRPFFQRLLSL
jgi:hypothetical protein